MARSFSLESSPSDNNLNPYRIFHPERSKERAGYVYFATITGAEIYRATYFLLRSPIQMRYKDKWHDMAGRPEPARVAT